METAFISVVCSLSAFKKHALRAIEIDLQIIVFKALSTIFYWLSSQSRFIDHLLFKSSYNRNSHGKLLLRPLPLRLTRFSRALQSISQRRLYIPLYLDPKAHFRKDYLEKN